MRGNKKSSFHLQFSSNVFVFVLTMKTQKTDDHYGMEGKKENTDALSLYVVVFFLLMMPARLAE